MKRINEYVLERFALRQIDLYYVGLSRCVLAIGTLLTLVFNDSTILFKSNLKVLFSGKIVLTNIFNPFLAFSEQYTTYIKIAACLILVLVIIGWRPRFTCIPHWLISTWFLNSALDFDGGDQITSNLTLLLIPICLIDNRRSHWQHRFYGVDEAYKNVFQNISLLVIRLQMALIYLHAAVGKFVVEDWINGSAIYYWSFHPIFGMGEIERKLATPLFQQPVLLFGLTWSVMILELVLFAGLLMDRKWYKGLFYAGVLFHIFIVLIHGLFSFFIAMTGGLVLFYLADYYSRNESLSQLKLHTFNNE
jgi:antimicrobial peptide system SdpB family protein